MKKILILFSLMTFSNIIFSQEYTGIITKVIDGDTVHMSSDNQLIKVRLRYIDAPEIGQAYGIKAKDFLKNLVLNQTVTVSSSYNDRYGRMIGDIYIYNTRENIYVNAKMIKSGNAWVYKTYRNNKYLINLEQIAKDLKNGIWLDDNPLEPWIHRQIIK